LAHVWVLVLLAAASAGATLLGGALALGLRSRLPLILGFSAGAVVGVALLDLLPECMSLGPPGGPPGAASLIALGFFAYLLADRALLAVAGGGASHRGHFGAGALSAHSLLDGLAIGLAFQASAAVGAVVAAAVLAHDLADGVNTVSVSLGGSPSRSVARTWLAIDAAAPVIGIGLSRLVVLPKSLLGAVLALFAGAFLYVGASQLLPESHARHPRAWTTVSTGLGLAAIWAAVRLAAAI
jgi:ZIP family zinc transporter